MLVKVGYMVMQVGVREHVSEGREHVPQQVFFSQFVGLEF